MFFHKKSAGLEQNILKVCRYVRYFLLCRVRLPFFVKTGEKHPRFYIKIFCFLNIKKARKHGLFKVSIHLVSPIWLRELDLNQRPSGYEPDELPNCSIPRYFTAFLLLSPECLFIISQMNVNVNTFFAIFLF